MYAGSNEGFLIRDATESTNGGGQLQTFRSRTPPKNQPELQITFG